MTATDVEQRIEHDIGLIREPKIDRGRISTFVHPATKQRFSLIPGGTFAMGIAADELVSALREIGYNPDVEAWRTPHRAWYEAATPVHTVTVQPFLCGRSPLLGGAIDAAELGISWSVHETAEHSGATAAAQLRAQDASRVLAHYSWELIHEAQWEYTARCGGRDPWAGGRTWRKAVDKLVRDPRCNPSHTNSNAWGVWGLSLGEWTADQWHENYVGAPHIACSWGSATPGTVRCGAVLHAPWQDSDEAIGCHAAIRQGDGSGRNHFRARPTIALPWLHIDPAPAQVSPLVDFETAVAELDREIRDAKASALRDRAQSLAERRAVLNSVQVGQIRSVGDDGVYIVKLATMNGILRMPELSPPLRVGETIAVRVVGSGGVPDVALVERGESEAST